MSDIHVCCISWKIRTHITYRANGEKLEITETSNVVLPFIVHLNLNRLALVRNLLDQVIINCLWVSCTI